MKVAIAVVDSAHCFIMNITSDKATLSGTTTIGRIVRFI
ncbi:protein of unknown function (plasmid) [Shinella sp. WSC3-e]|nr:protein of unknown function [Shinella sp. WSC3-e]